MKALAIISAALLSSVFLAGCSLNVKSLRNGDKYTAGNATITDTVESICIDWASGEVNIEKGGTGEVSIVETYQGELPKEKQMHWWLDGTTLRIRYDISIGWNIGTSQQKNLTVTIPDNMGLKSLEIDAASALINILDIPAENIDIDTASGNAEGSVTGDVKVADIDTASGKVIMNFSGKVGKADLDTASGDINIVFALGADESDYSAASGDIDVAYGGDAKKCKFSTASGKVTASFASQPENVDIDTASGTVNLTLPEDADFTADIDTGSGDINFSYPMTKNGDKYIVGSGTNTIKIDTASGDVSINSN